MGWKEETARLYQQAGLELLNDGDNTIVRGKNYYEVLNVCFRSTPIGTVECPEISEISRWWRGRYPERAKFAQLEQANYLDISSQLSLGFPGISDPNSRRFVQVTPRSMLPSNERADFPSCIPVVHLQFRDQIAFVTGFFRSLDVNLMRLDCAWLFWLGKTYAQYAEYQFQKPFKWVKLTLYISNLHRTERSDGGLE
jgi:hypothetical protein